MTTRHGWRALTWCALGLAASAPGASCSAGRCRGDVAEVAASGCPSTFDGTAEDLPPCEAGERQAAWMCADLIALSLSGGYSGGTCYYHPTSHLLVGFLEFNDTPSFCGNSFTKVAGRTPAAACSSTDALVKRVCPFEPASDGGPSDRGAPVDGGA